MAGVKGNRRILYTKKIIKESLIDLLKYKKIHEVTVTDICKKSNINRGTFYTHYKDVLLLKALELIYDNKDLCKILFSKQMETDLMDRIIYVASKSEIDKLVSSSKIDDVFLDYFIKYTVGGVVSVIQTWLENDLNEPPKEIVRIINNIIAFHP